MSSERMSHLLRRRIPEVAPARRERSFCPLVHPGLHSVQRSSGLSAPINVCTERIDQKTNDFGRMLDQRAIGCAQTKAADRLGRPATQPNLSFVRRTRTAQARTLVRTTPLMECRRDLSPLLPLSAAYPGYFSSPI